MFLLMGVLASLLISAAELWKFTPERTIKRGVAVCLKNAVSVTVITSILQTYVFQYEHFLKTDAYGGLDFFLIFLLALLVGAVLLTIHAIANHSITFDRQEVDPKKGRGLRILGLVLVFLGCMCIFATEWSKAEYGDLPIDQLFITYFSPTTGSDMVDYTDVLEGPVLLSLFFTTIYGLLAFSKARISYHSGDKAKVILAEKGHRIVSLVLAIAMLVSGVIYGVCRFQLISLVNAYLNTSSFIDDNYVDPRDANLQFPEKKRNLIHIYLESMENSYMSKDLGGFMDENLIPELTQIAREGYSFSHLPDQFGGPESAIGTTWSVASMVNMSTGLPMKAPTKPNAYGSEDNFLPGACTLGDILQEQGYEQTLMFGADSDFGGLTYYFKSHGDYKIMDYKYAIENGLIPKDYLVWWGYEDDKLFEYAKEELTRLSEIGKPFNFVMETADTHRPEGYLSENAPTPYPNQYANVIAYSSAEVDKFVRWIQEQPFYDNTTIIITGDHLSMESIFFEFYNFDEDYRRSQYNVILNPYPGVASDSEEILYNRDYANFDFFPTILTCMGVTYDGSRLGIGTDLFSGDPTIFEEYGFKKANKELEKRSKLYNEHILEDPNLNQ